MTQKFGDATFNTPDIKNAADVPSPNPDHVHADIVADLKLVSEVFQRIESETAEIAEEIFDYLIDVADLHIMDGEIPEHSDPKIARYIRILNRLFRLSRKKSKEGLMSLIVINRKTVKELDKKTYTISMCFDGGVSLDILCDIVNEENRARTPTRSPVKITIRRAFGGEHELNNSGRTT
jgi:hypothetical protein